MMHIESLRRGVVFKVAVKEHEAVIKCEPQDLVLIAKRKFAYSCPICGRIHTVPAYRVEEIKTYNVDVDLNDPSLPINIEKAEKAAAEKRIGNLYKRIKKLEKLVKENDPKTSNMSSEMSPDTLRETRDKMNTSIRRIESAE